MKNILDCGKDSYRLKGQGVTNHKKEDKMSGAVIMLTHARESLGLKKSELSRLIGIHESFLSRVESGKKNITEDLEGFADLVTKLLAPPLRGGSATVVTPEEIVGALDNIPKDRKKGYIINMTLAGLGLSKGRTEIVGLATGINLSESATAPGDSPDMLALKRHIDDLKEQIRIWAKSSSPEAKAHYVDLVKIFAQASVAASFAADADQKDQDRKKGESQ